MCSFKFTSKVIVNLDFRGYITENNINSIPQSSGIYVAFVYDTNDKGIHRTAYIGKAEGTNNLRKRIQEHFDNEHSKWAKTYKLSDTETFVYVYAVFDDSILADVESALIFKNQPIINVQHKDRYNGKSYFLCINCRGNIGLLKPLIFVSRFI